MRNASIWINRAIVYFVMLVCAALLACARDGAGLGGAGDAGTDASSAPVDDAGTAGRDAADSAGETGAADGQVIVPLPDASVADSTGIVADGVICLDASTFDARVTVEHGSEGGGEPDGSALPSDAPDDGEPGGEGDEPCRPNVASLGDGPYVLGTTDAVCLRRKGEINGWLCSNFEGRTISVNRVPVKCAELPLPPKWKGYYYFDISSGLHAYASLAWW
jgi:hypothetical protein